LHNVIQNPDIVIEITSRSPRCAGYIPARGRHHIRTVRPYGVRSFCASPTFLADSGMCKYQVIHHAIIIGVELVPGETWLACIEGINGIDYGLLDPYWVIWVPYIAGIASLTAISRVPGL